MKELNFVGSADSRETDVEVMQAILTVAGGNEQLATKIWEDGTHIDEVKSELIKNGHNPKEMCWGSQGTNW